MGVGGGCPGLVKPQFSHSTTIALPRWREVGPLYLVISPADFILKVPFLRLTKEQTLVVLLADFLKCVYNRMPR